MSNSHLKGLGVTAQDVSRVESNVLAHAEAEAERAEQKEVDDSLEAIEKQLSDLQREENDLSQLSFTTKRSRQLDSISRKIATLTKKRDRLIEAQEARKELTKNLTGFDPSVADDTRAEGESEREFLIRTGKLTPFQGQSGYERAQSAAPTIRRRRVKSMDLSYVDSDDSVVELGCVRSDEENIQAEVNNIEKPRSKSSKRNQPRVGSDDEDEYVPEEISKATSEDGSDWEQENISSSKKRKRGIAGLSDDADEETYEPQVSEELREGDDWAPEDDEEVEFEGGLKLPSSVYDKLFDYQKTGVSYNVLPTLERPLSFYSNLPVYFAIVMLGSMALGTT